MDIFTQLEPYLEDPVARAHYYSLPKVGAGFGVIKFYQPDGATQLVALMIAETGVHAVGFLSVPITFSAPPLQQLPGEVFYTGEIVGYDRRRDRWIAKLYPLPPDEVPTDETPSHNR